MSEEDRLSMLEHWIGTYMVIARMALEEGDVEEAEGDREKLIKKLEGLETHPAIDGCLDYLRQHEWRTPVEIDGFKKRYDELNPHSNS